MNNPAIEVARLRKRFGGTTALEEAYLELTRDAVEFRAAAPGRETR